MSFQREAHHISFSRELSGEKPASARGSAELEKITSFSIRERKKDREKECDGAEGRGKSRK